MKLVSLPVVPYEASQSESQSPAALSLPLELPLRLPVLQAKFTAEQHPQYIYSPRELSRWVRALYEAMEPLDAMTLEELVRLWANEALRLFHDRLVTQEEQDWCQGKVRVWPARLPPSEVHIL